MLGNNEASTCEAFQILFVIIAKHGSAKVTTIVEKLTLVARLPV
jgi:hypothetical protein